MTKQEILDRFKDINEAYNDSSRYDSLSRMINELLKEQEAVVQCKDCKHGRRMKTENGIEVYCENNRIERIFCEQDWFCADGERKADT